MFVLDGAVGRSPLIWRIPANMATNIREWFLRIVMLFGSLLFCLVLLEGVVRFIEPREVMRYFFVQADSVLHHKFIPNAKGRFVTNAFDTHYQINSFGLRDEEYAIEKPHGSTRILMVGDSFTEGIGVEADKTFSKIVEGLLNCTGTNSKYEVINAGVGSYSPLPEFLYLKSAGLKLNPDIVVLNLDLSDMYDDIQYTQLARFDPDGIPLGISPEHGQTDGSWFTSKLVEVKDFFKENTRSYNFIKLRISRYNEGIQHEGKAIGDIRLDKYAMLRPDYVRRNQDWVLTHKYILLIRDMLKERGIRFLLTVYPYGMQVSPREFNVGRQFWGFRPDTLYSTEPQKLVEEFCHKEGIPVINACADFRNAAGSQYPLYIDDNGHWTAAGHKVFGQILSRGMQSLGLLK
jgi:hypothetical protein